MTSFPPPYSRALSLPFPFGFEGAEPMVFAGSLQTNGHFPHKKPPPPKKKKKPPKKKTTPHTKKNIWWTPISPATLLPSFPFHSLFSFFHPPFWAMADFFVWGDPSPFSWLICSACVSVTNFFPVLSDSPLPPPLAEIRFFSGTSFHNTIDH